MDIAIDCAGLAVKGVEAVLAYDPILLHLDAITAGPWYTDTGQYYFFFDYTGVDPEGMIHFASSILDGTNDQSLTLAVCNFTALDFGSTPVIFQTVDVRGPDNMDLGFGHSIGDLILIDSEIGEIDKDSYSNFRKLEKEKTHFESNAQERKKKDKDLGKLIKSVKRQNKNGKY